MAQLLLWIDAIINLGLGFFLALLPRWTVGVFGLPELATGFYARVLGAVLFGIGLALTFEALGLGGLRLAGAVAINLCGAAMLVLLLVAGPPVALRGRVMLWLLAAVLVLLSAFELTLV